MYIMLMKKTAILVIASTQFETYRIYIEKYWTKMIKYTNDHTPNIKIFLLFDYGSNLDNFSDIKNNIIIDNNNNYNGYSPKGLKCKGFIPGILSKTIYSFKKLQNEYDIFFRTNLSSMVHITNLIKYIENHKIIYSGFYVWGNALRRDLQYHKKIGPNKSIQNLDELQGYPGNTFISGSAYFINSQELTSILENEHKIRYDIIDDVSVGLMIKNHESLDRKYHLCIRSSDVDDNGDDNVYNLIKRKIEKGVFHIRLQHFPTKIAYKFHDLMDKFNMIDFFH